MDVKIVNSKSKIVNPVLFRSGLLEKTKPIRRALPGNPKLETRNSKRVERVHLKKQSQYAGVLNIRNISNNNGLWRF